MDLSKGKAGKIGADKIRARWQYGKYVREDYIRNERHWREIIGYLQKKGYVCKGKAHQVRLPEWARNQRRSIRRFTRKNGQKAETKTATLFHEKKRREDKLVEKKIDEIDDYSERQSKKLNRPTQGEKIDACGQQIEIYRGQGFGDLYATAKIPYRKALNILPGMYVKDQGYVTPLDAVNGLLADLARENERVSYG